MNKGDYVLLVLFSIVLVLWAVFCYFCFNVFFVSNPARFTFTYFVLLVSLIFIGIISD